MLCCAALRRACLSPLDTTPRSVLCRLPAAPGRCPLPLPPHPPAADGPDNLRTVATSLLGNYALQTLLEATQRVRAVAHIMAQAVRRPGQGWGSVRAWCVWAGVFLACE